MAGEQEPLDLVGLFGLSEEEALSLGLPSRDDVGGGKHAPVSVPQPGDVLGSPHVSPALTASQGVPADSTGSPAGWDVFTADSRHGRPADGDLAALQADVLRVLSTSTAAGAAHEVEVPRVASTRPARARQPVRDDPAPSLVDDRTVPQPSALEMLLRRLPRDTSPLVAREGDPHHAVPAPPTDDEHDAGRAASDVSIDPGAGFGAGRAYALDEDDDDETVRLEPVTVAPVAPSFPATTAVPAAPQVPEGLGTPSAFLQELLAVFVEEATELLDGFHTTLEVLERTPSQGAMAEARRQVHTIKGGARMCGLGPLSDLAHACEDVLAMSASSDRTLAHRAIALLFRAEQEMRAALGTPDSGPGLQPGLPALLADLALLARSEGAAPLPASPSETAPLPEAARLDRALEHDARSSDDRPTAARSDAASVSTAGQSELADPEEPGEMVPAQNAPAERDAAPRRQATATPAPHAARLAVDLHKVEGVVAKVTEIVANRATSHTLLETLGANVMDVMRTVHRLQAVAMQLQYQIASAGIDITEDADPEGLALETYGPIKQSLLQLHEAIADQQALVQQTIDSVNSRQALAATETRLDTDLQSALLNMRLLPLSQLRVRLDQVVRSAAVSAGREVRWSMEGQHVSLDKNVCDRLFEPLMHLLRNAIDHGIEPPEERLARGKQRVGRIVVQASIEGNQATISVSDDGRGINPEHIASVAIERGVITEQHALSMGDAEKMELIFRPGFSTAKAVTDLSGRGVGMEIVRETCIRMGGTVTVSARPGGGTTTTMHVPLSLSLIHALIVSDAGRKLCIPAPQVLSVHLVRSAAVHEHSRRQFVRIGRDSLPLFRLPPPPAPVRGSPIAPDDELTVLLVPLHNSRVAVVVDALVHEEDLIVKPLPLLLHGVDCLLGAVVLSSGEAIPVLNLPPQLEQIQAADSAPTVFLAAVAPARAEQVVLVVDDSLTMRTALTQTLSTAGYTVLAARDGQEALELIRTRGMPRLVTLDVEMPRMDGLETLYAIRHLSGGEKVPVFMLTTRSGQKHQRTALQLGATRYFTKPYHDREFLRAVQEVTGSPLRPTG